MNGASAPPGPTFDQIAEKFGLTVPQLEKLVTSPQGRQMFDRLAAGYQTQNNATQGIQSGMAQGNLQGYAGLQGAQTPPFANQGLSALLQQPQSPTDEELLQLGMKKMNPIAREKYEPVFKLLGIKLRYTGDTYHEPGWVIQKQAANGKQYRMTWSSPENDIGCALSTWDAMVGELLDQCKRADDGERDNHRS